MASIQKFSRLGYRIYWRLYFPDGTFKEKYKASKSKTTLKELLPDVVKIESLSRRNEISGQDLIRAFNLKLITKEEIKLFSNNIEIPEEHYLHELRSDFETKSKAQSPDLHSHKANMAKANILEDYFKDIPLHKLTPELIEKFRAERKKIVSNTTINHDLKALRKYLDIAVHKGWIKQNPARQVKLFSEPKGRIPRCLYPEELKILFGNLNKFKHFLHGDFPFIIKMLIYTGLRRGELCKLKPENIKLNLRQIHILGKGQKARIVGIHQSLLEELRGRIKKGNIIHPTIRPDSITKAFKKAVRQLGLPEALSLHSLRHTYITYLLEKGIPTKKVKERAGHFSLVITDHYTHAIPSSEVLEDVLDFG